METSHCLVSYLLPAWEGFAGAELKYCLVVGESDLIVGGSCDAGRVRISSARRRRPCGRCGTPCSVYSRREIRVGWTEGIDKAPLHWDWSLGPVLLAGLDNKVVRLAKRRTVWGRSISCSSRF